MKIVGSLVQEANADLAKTTKTPTKTLNAAARRLAGSPSSTA